MKSKVLTTAAQLSELCRELEAAELIGFDTEFVAEHTYRPALCLVQVATPDRLVAVDAQAVGDMTEFWRVLAEGDHQTVVHAGREELCFSLRAVDKPPANLIDVQLAAGLVGNDYPAGYGSLTDKLLGVRIPKGETRTDWRKRPLSSKQIEYALNDVRHLLPLRDALLERIDKHGRRGWLDEEMKYWREDIEESQSRQRWRRVSGAGNLPARTMAIVRELWLWREAEAERRDWPPRRVLRDDLIVEIARRKVTDPKQILAVRGLERGHLFKAADELVACVQRALSVPDAELPRGPRRDTSPQLTMLGQFLSSALNSICREAEVATSLVGNPTDVRDLISYRLNPDSAYWTEPPRLTGGWRAEVVGHLLEELLAGQVTIRIKNPRSDEPLEFKPYKK